MSDQYSILSVKTLLLKVSDSKLYPQFIFQIQKDINRAGINYKINSSKPEDLFIEIRSLLMEKIQNSFNDYLNLLYAIDVSETQIRNTKPENINNIVDNATFLLLKREWTKVWCRNNI